MPSRGNKEIRAARERHQAVLVQREQKRSALPKSVSKFGHYKTTQHANEVTDVIRKAAGTSKRHPAPITLAPLPWKD